MQPESEIVLLLGVAIAIAIALARAKTKGLRVGTMFGKTKNRANHISFAPILQEWGSLPNLVDRFGSVPARLVRGRRVGFSEKLGTSFVSPFVLPTPDILSVHALVQREIDPAFRAPTYTSVGAAVAAIVEPPLPPPLPLDDMGASKPIVSQTGAQIWI